jgi:hypothetical protein
MRNPFGIYCDGHGSLPKVLEQRLRMIDVMSLPEPLGQSSGLTRGFPLSSAPASVVPPQFERVSTSL